MIKIEVYSLQMEVKFIDRIITVDLSLQKFQGNRTTKIIE